MKQTQFFTHVIVPGILGEKWLFVKNYLLISSKTVYNPILLKIIPLLLLKKPLNYSIIFSALWGHFNQKVAMTFKGVCL